VISVVTINIWNKQGPWPRRLEILRRQLAALDPDLIALQEVMHLPGAGANQAEELAQPLDFRVAYATAWPIAGGPLELGNALLSRWPILEQRTFTLPVERSGEEGRSLLYALVDAPAGRLPVYVTHLSWQFHVSHVRAQQVRAVDDAVRETAGAGVLPPILMGDFNAEPESDEIRFLRGLTALGGRGTYWADCFALAGRGPGATYSRQNPYAADLREPERRIDYVFVRGPDKHKRGEPLAARVVLTEPEGEVWPSDHFGVHAEISD
jgi:endonuclease/exonuclease/phosphatase family metal-dependent hydrolase